jgi:hypothetical protein
MPGYCSFFETFPRYTDRYYPKEEFFADPAREKFSAGASEDLRKHARIGPGGRFPPGDVFFGSWIQR